MKTITLSLLAAAAIGAVSIGSASAMPFSSGPAALGESLVQDVRLVCNEYGRCWNTNRRAHRSSRYYAPRQYNRGYYSSGYYGDGYHGYARSPGVGIGVGPVGVRIW